jgi:hypothetical protein
MDSNVFEKRIKRILMDSRVMFVSNKGRKAL